MPGLWLGHFCFLGKENGSRVAREYPTLCMRPQKAGAPAVLGIEFLGEGGLVWGVADTVAAAGFCFVEGLVCSIEKMLSSTGRGRGCGGDAAGDRERRFIEGSGGVLEGREASDFD